MSIRPIAFAFALASLSCSGTPDTDGRGGMLALDMTTNGSLTADDDAVPPDRVAPYTADRWTIMLTAGQPVSIAMCRANANLDPLLSLFDGTVTPVPDAGIVAPVAVDDDSAGDNGSLIQFIPSATGPYYLYAQDCCTQPLPNDGLNRDYTIQVASGMVALTCGDAGAGDMDAAVDGGDDADMDAAGGMEM